MIIKKTIQRILLGMCIMLPLQLSTAAEASNNYYNVLLDDVSANKYRHGVDKATEVYNYFKATNTFKDVLEFPDFDGFSNLILPDTTKEHLDYPLNMLSKIMTLHRNVKTINTLESLEFLANECKRGKQVFYSFYTDEEVSKDPSLHNTGLFFFRGKKNAPFAIVVPGGYKYRTILHEGFPIAIPISRRGYNVFVLSYRIGEVTNGSEDLVKAIKYIQKNGARLGIKTDKYSLWGSSVGAQVIINVCHKALKNQNYLKDLPSANILSYPLSFFPTKNDIPTFIVVGDQDKIVNSTILKSSVVNLKKNGIEADYLVMPRLGHGFGLGINQDSSVGVNWISRAVSFWSDVSDFSEE